MIQGEGGKLENTIESRIRAMFDAPLREFYKRRIVFWQDPDNAFAEEIDALSIPNVKILRLTGTNNFEAKKLLLHDDPGSDYLVYNPVRYEHVQDNWLLDIEFYSEAFYADQTTERMDALNIHQSPQLRRTVLKYAKFFESKERCAKLSRMKDEFLNPAELEVAIMATLTGAGTISPSAVIEAVLSACADPYDKESASLDALRRFGDWDAFWHMVQQRTGYAHQDGKPPFELAAHIILTALAQTMDERHLKSLEKYISYPHRAACHQMVHDWTRGEQGGWYHDLSRHVEHTLGLPDKFAGLDIPDLVGSDCLPCIDECILKRFLQEIAERVVKIEEIQRAVQKRRTQVWYQPLRDYYEGILQVAYMQQFYREHAGGFHETDLGVLWAKYAKEYSLMDRYYRLFHLAFGRSLRQTNMALGDLFKGAAERVEALYKGWFLDNLGEKSTALLPIGPIDEPIIRQKDFYEREVARATSGGGRVFVIISDALRYEVGAQLAEELTRDMRGKSTIESWMGVFPTATKFGMAALLPRRKLSLTEDLSVLADGLSTSGIDAREKVLMAAKSGSMALSYREFIAMKKDERRKAAAGQQVIYVYHDAIDAIGDKLATEDDVFEACDVAIAEIKNLVKVIVNELSGANVLITADHGFIYTHEPLRESDKADKSLFDGEVVEIARRYAIAKAGCQAEHMIQMPLTDFGERELVGFAPKEYMRLKIKGGGMRYVHGGVSLQEMAVPLIRYKDVRADSKQFAKSKCVKLQLVGESRKVSNSLFSLDFFQSEPIGGKLLAGKYEVFMADVKGSPVSDRHVIIADKQGKVSAERITRVKFSLNSMKFDKLATYHLVIRDQSGGEPDMLTEFQIDIAFTNDFDF